MTALQCGGSSWGFFSGNDLSGSIPTEVRRAVCCGSLRGIGPLNAYAGSIGSGYSARTLLLRALSDDHGPSTLTRWGS